MSTPADQPATPLTTTERQTADELLARATCTHLNPVETTMYGVLGKQQQAWLCTFCGEKWRTVNQ